VSTGVAESFVCNDLTAFNSAKDCAQCGYS
jgi:hypothetical protein